MSYEEFQKILTQDGKRNVRFREEGKHGWSSLDVDENGEIRLTPGADGPHYVDASPIPAGRYLLGKYDFKTGEAIFY